MKCPEWLLEALAKGEGVKCMVNNGESLCYTGYTQVIGFSSTRGFESCKGLFYKYAEPYKESEHEFKPFDKVLVRDYDSDEWKAGFFSHRHCSGTYYRCVGASWRCCITYEGNEHLLGTTDNP